MLITHRHESRRQKNRNHYIQHIAMNANCRICFHLLLNVYESLEVVRLTEKVQVQGLLLTKGARAAIEAAGGKVVEA